MKIDLIKLMREDSSDILEIIKNETIEQGELNGAVSYCLEQKKSVDILKALLEKGADINCHYEYLECKPIHLAARNGLIKHLEVLINCGADLNALAGYEEDTALHEATDRNRIEIVKKLISSGASPCIKNVDGKLPRDYVKMNFELRNILEEAESNYNK